MSASEMLNRVTFSRSKGAVSYRKEPISSKVDVVNFKATLVFLTFQLC